MIVKKGFTTVALLVLCLAIPAALFAADWPRFLGPDGTGIAPDTGINKDWNQRPPKELWRFAMSDSGCSGPSVAGGRVYIIDHQGEDDVVRALDLSTANEVWKFAYAAPTQEDYGYARATPTIAEGKVYTLGRTGLVYCLDDQTGTEVWHRNIQADFGGQMPGWGYSMSVTVDGDAVVLCPGGPDASVVKLDRNTGETTWAGGGSDVPGYATPVVAEIQGAKQYVVFTNVSVIGVAADTGQLLWRVPWETTVNVATPIVSGDRVFITSGYGHGCAMI